MSYTHFTLKEREYLQKLLSEGKKFREIAEYLGRNVSSVSREIRRNRSKYPPKKKSNNRYNYHAWRAETLSIVRQRYKRHFRLEPGSEEWKYIIENLKQYWSPEEISHRWRIDHPDKEIFGTSTVYRYLNHGVFEGVSRKGNLRRRGKKIMTRNANYNSIQPERIIPEWPEEIRMRKRIGDWEGDTIYGGVGKGLAVTLVDRKSLFLAAGLLEKRNAEMTKEVVINLLKDKPRHSISFDNGSEFSEYRKIENDLQTTVYFAEPHKPWQRGTNENTNGLLRFFFPKGIDFHQVTQEDLDFVVNLLNHRPRKRLGWKTPHEVFWENFVALT